MFRNVDASRSIPRNFCPAKHLFLLAFRRKNSEKRRTAMRISRSVRGIRISDVEKTVNAARQTELTVRARAFDTLAYGGHSPKITYSRPNFCRPTKASETSTRQLYYPARARFLAFNRPFYSTFASTCVYTCKWRTHNVVTHIHADETRVIAST